jgi:tetratricopeptide (TPR) repeat protein
MRLAYFRLAVAVLVPCLSGCAPRVRLDPGPGIALTAELVRADALVSRGCYTCLQEALAIYERAAVTGRAPAAGLRTIDTLLLLALRERELGLGSGQSLERAVDLASRQPSPFDISVFVAVADSQSWHAGGVSKERYDESMGPLRRMSGAWPDWRAQLQPGADSDVLRGYYLLSLDCSARSFLNDAGIESWKPAGDAPPILRFRTSVCPNAFDESTLANLLKADPRWADAHFFLGELALGQRKLRTAEKHLVEAAAAIPGLVAARLTLGHVYLAMEDVDLALHAYHEVNAAVPGQREAMLGEVKSLSYLGRHQDAVTILDGMERLGTWYMGEVYYWRAWNRHRLKENDAANEDVLASRSRMPMSPQVDALAGFIAIARNEVARAEREFRLAVQHFEGRGERDCDSGYYLASALVLQRKWAEAVPFFERAEPCYALDEKAVRDRIAAIRASDLPDDRQDRLVAAKEKDILKVRLQQARSCFNAAVALANLGEVDKARPLAERAAAHPDLKDLVQPLLARLDGK